MNSEEANFFDYKPMKLNELSGFISKKPKRIGRGIGSGNGKTAGKGHKGQRARAGARRSNIFQGGQMPLERRIPKRGFRSLKKMIKDHTINLCQLDHLNNKFGNKNLITKKDLIDAKIIYIDQQVKLLSKGEVRNSISIEVHKVSKLAKQKIEALGGKIVIISN